MIAENRCPICGSPALPSRKTICFRVIDGNVSEQFECIRGHEWRVSPWQAEKAVAR